MLWVNINKLSLSMIELYAVVPDSTAGTRESVPITLINSDAIRLRLKFLPLMRI